MDAVKIRNTVIGEGMPKICVPIVGATKEDILEEARAIKSLPADVVEWRVDRFNDVLESDRLMDVLKGLREVLGDMPVLLTFRTSKEGGEKAIDNETYTRINVEAAKSGYVDMIDVEIFAGDEIVTEIIEAAHAAGIKVVASNHDFDKTPDKDDIVARLRKMQDMGADISKIAVMPNSKQDVLTLLAATEEMSRKYADRPIATMSMADTGLISRLAGEVFGSALTFGAASVASAPGQMRVEALKAVLTYIHEAI